MTLFRVDVDYKVSACAYLNTGMTAAIVRAAIASRVAVAAPGQRVRTLAIQTEIDRHATSCSVDTSALRRSAACSATCSSGRTVSRTTAGAVSAVPNWDVGELITFGAIDQARVVGIQWDGLAPELEQQGIRGIFTIEPVDE
jgi:hypothetical protein